MIYIYAKKFTEIDESVKSIHFDWLFVILNILKQFLTAVITGHNVNVSIHFKRKVNKTLNECAKLVGNVVVPYESKEFQIYKYFENKENLNKNL